jgi:hypothetical protein
VLEMSSQLPKGRPTSIYKHPKQIEPLGAKRVADARDRRVCRSTDRRAVQRLLLLVDATDASVAHPTDVLPSVCRTYVCHVSRPFELYHVCAHCIRRVRRDRASVCRSDRHGPVSPIRENNRQTRSLPARQTRRASVARATAKPWATDADEARLSLRRPRVCRARAKSRNRLPDRRAHSVCRSRSRRLSPLFQARFHLFLLHLFHPFTNELD